MGSRIGGATAELFAADRYRDYLELHGLSVQLTEALAELWHARVRSELGLGPDGDMLGMLTNQAYQGSRYSFGYLACPDLADRAKLVALLDPGRIGVELSPEFQLHPEQATDALIVHHPQARYFSA
jgi:5-methyltetrahydrofolate--homocysteine methyltransferase